MTTGNLGSDSNQPSKTTNQEDFSLHTLQYTYTGLLDDVMVRYSNEYLSEDFFNKMIAKNIFFGGGIYINDGYLVNHPRARGHLKNDKENTLLRRMLSEGFIRILTRAGDARILSQMPQRMAEQGNQSFQELVNGNEWEEELSPNFTRIAQSAFQKGHARQWPNRDMSYGFTKLMVRAFSEEITSKLGLRNISRDEWLRIRDGFLERNPQSGGPRDKLEKSALDILGERSDYRTAMNEIMTIGNQAYHYNFGLTLTDEDEYGVAVDTTLGAAFDELLETTQVERGQLDHIPLLRLPQDIPFERGDLFLDFLDSSTQAGQAKLNYLRSLRRVISSESRNFDALRQELIESTDEYVNRIIELLHPSLERLALERMREEFESFTVGLQEGSQIGTFASPFAFLTINIKETAENMGRQFLVERFQLTDVSQEFDPSERIIRLGNIRPQIASLAFDKHEASNFIEDIPPAPTF